MTLSSRRRWWKEGVVYQIYPRSFQDTNGDGIGDLRGIINRLDYIKSLGVDIIWLNPIYPSPNDDNGYDISDYQNIMSEFGTMADFDELLSGMHARGIRLIMDLVVNHSSDEHPWFVQSRSSRDNPYRDYYYWWPAEKGAPPKRWSYFDIESNGWKYDDHTDAYYLHYFSVKQPDLKWENKKVRFEVYDMMKYWFEKGVDGFRMDVISFISKDVNFPKLKNADSPEDFIEHYAHGPRLHEFLKEMNAEVLSKYDVMTVGEAPGIHIQEALDFVDEDREELNMFFHFDLMALDRAPGEVFRMNPDGWSLEEFKRIFSEWDAVFAKKGWGSVYLNNHDFPRTVSRWGNDHPDYWRHSATMLQTFLLTMRGTPYFYYGEEIGMTNIRFDHIDQYRDINTINEYRQRVKQGEDTVEYLLDQKYASRDNARTPMQWDSSAQAGFTSSTPWIEVNKNYEKGINVQTQDENPNSVLNYFRKMVQIRKDNLTLVYGDYALVDVENSRLYAYSRTSEKETFLILLSFSTEPESFSLPETFSNDGQLITSNAEWEVGSNKLRPYQAVVLRY